MLLACLTYGVVIINDPPLQIPFADGTLIPRFSWAFWQVLVTGCLTVLAALVIVFIDIWFPRKAAKFFHHSTIVDDTIFQVCVIRIRLIPVLTIYQYHVSKVFRFFR